MRGVTTGVAVENTRMSKAFKFNPGFQSDEEAVANFVVRTEEFEDVLEAFAPAGPPKSPPRVLVVAPRGAGKTTLCRRVLAESRGSGRLAAGWHAIFLGEESYVVTTPGEFFLECLFHLRDQTPGAVPDEHYGAAEAAKDEDALVKATLAALRDFSARTGRRLLVVVENFHTLLREQIGTDAGRLLELLSEEVLFGVLATSVAEGFVEGDDGHGPLHDYLRITLQPLPLLECHRLWEALTDRSVKVDRIRPLQILTGGSPRLLHILADFMRTPSLHDLMANLNQLIDQNTEYFKSQLDALPAIERKVFAALLDAWDPQSAKQIAESARVNTNIASAMLGRLHDRGAVMKGPSEGRAVIYFASERLFNIYYLMRRRSHPSNRVRALVSFMTEYYDHDELVKTTAMLVREACAIDPERRSDYHSTFCAILSGTKDDTVRQRILDETPREFIRSFRKDRGLLHQDEIIPNIPPSQSEKDKVLTSVVKDFEAAADRGDFPQALEILRLCLEKHPDLPGVWLRLSLVHQRLGEYDVAVEEARRAVDLSPDDAWSWAVLGQALQRTESGDEAEAAFAEALDRDPRQIMALVELAEIREADDDLEGALNLYRAARNAGPIPDLLWSRFALLLLEHGRDEEAEKVLRAGNQESLEHIDTRHMLVDLLDDTNRQEEAILILRSSAEALDNWLTWTDLGSFLIARTDRTSLAKQALDKAIEKGADRIRPFSYLAQALFELDAPPEALTGVALRATEVVVDKGAAWSLAGDIYARLGEEQSAELAFRTAIELNAGVGPTIGLARVLASKADGRAEAETLLREVVDDPNSKGVCAAARELAEMLVHSGEDASAEEIVQRTLADNEECICCLLLHGQICARRGDNDQAIARFEAVLDLDEDSISALTGLALVDPDQADDLLARAIDIAPNSPRSLYARAKLLKSNDPDGQIDDLRTALEREVGFLPAVLMLATLEAQRGEADHALGRLAVALDKLSIQREWLTDFVTAAMSVAKHGLVGPVLDLVMHHKAAATLEPLVVALQLSRGENPRVAKEVLEVATDILGRSS